MSAIAESITARLQDRIAAELQASRGFSPTAFPAWIESGDGQAVNDALVFFANPAELAGQSDDLCKALEGRFK